MRIRPFSTATASQLAGLLYLTLAQFAASLVSRWLIFAELRIRSLLDVNPLEVLAATRQDVTVAVIAAATAISINVLLGRRWPKFAPRLLLAFAIGHCFLLAVNAFAVRWIGGPLTLHWLYFADLLQTATPRAALAGIVSPRVVIIVAAVTALPLVTPFFGRLVIGSPPRKSLLTPIGCSVAVLSLFFALSALVWPAKDEVFQDLRYSPIRAMWASAFSRVPALDDCAEGIVVEELVAATPVGGNARRPPKKSNFVLVVLESVGAKAIGVSRPRLPTLDKMMRSGTVFTNAYAATASTTRSLFALLTSRYPLVDFRPETRELRRSEFISLPEVLRRAGYRTAFFGVDLAFQDAERFIRAEGFDVAHEALDGHCARRRQLDRLDYPAYSVPDSCIFASAAAWAARAQPPFFLTIWSNDSHAPYTTNGNFAGRFSRANYDRGLATTDQALGQLVARLKRGGRLDDTIFVIVGDHGEAFGEHGRRFHSTTIFEEEVKVPLILYGTPLGLRGTDDRLARLVDVAPSIASMAGVPLQPGWTGLDLFSTMGVNRLYFFTTYRGVQLGFREGNTKYVLDYDKGLFSKYRLDQDPSELSPIALAPEERARAEAHAAAWVARERRRYRSDGEGNCETRPLSNPRPISAGRLALCLHGEGAAC